MKKSSFATIRDVAAAAGVSMTTVSDIITGRSDRFKEETLMRVRKTAEKLSYRPHLGASAMRSQRFNTIGLILSQSPFYEAKLVEGVDEVAHARELGLMLVHIGPAEEDLPSLVTHNQVDGLIVDWTSPKKIGVAIENYRIPAVWVNNDQHAPENCIWPDDEAGGRMATEHLIALGHRRIAFLRVPQAMHPSQEFRLKGYCQALTEAGLEPRVIDCECLDFPLDIPTDPNCFKNRFSHPEIWADMETGSWPTAFVCYSTLTALELYAACQRKGVEVQKAFAVVSCDELLERVEIAYPAITTVVVDHALMGRLAVDMLCERIENNGKAVPSKILPLRLNVRESSFKMP
ncbi:MAG: LacI family DNA-binding transcriptional regulator [Phycisphaerae bacterium]